MVDVDIEQSAMPGKSAGQYAPYVRDVGSDDETAVMKGHIDPVYEAKAIVLNKAVSSATHPEPVSNLLIS